MFLREKKTWKHLSFTGFVLGLVLVFNFFSPAATYIQKRLNILAKWKGLQYATASSKSDFLRFFFCAVFVCFFVFKGKKTYMHTSKKNQKDVCQIMFSGEPWSMPINLYLCQAVISSKITLHREEFSHTKPFLNTHAATSQKANTAFFHKCSKIESDFIIHLCSFHFVLRWTRKLRQLKGDYPKVLA